MSELTVLNYIFMSELKAHDYTFMSELTATCILCTEQPSFHIQ